MIGNANSLQSLSYMMRTFEFLDLRLSLGSSLYTLAVEPVYYTLLSNKVLFLLSSSTVMLQLDKFCKWC